MCIRDRFEVEFARVVRLYYSRMQAQLAEVGLYRGQPPIMALLHKRDGMSQKEDVYKSQDKIRRGLIKACEKRPVAMGDVDALVRDVEQQIYNSLEREVSSSRIGEMVMERLRNLDEVAYVRFASVYRSFCDINTFMEELKSLLSTPKE